MKKTFYVTTPIYYPSGDLHIGHLYTTTLARTLANYKKLVGYDVKMLTGADEHGQKIQEKAKASNLDPQAYVDLMSDKFRNLWKKLNIKYDYFSRTSNKKHKDAVSKQFSSLLEKGEIYKGEYKGLYSISDEEFLTETQAEKRDGKYYHPVSGHELTEVSEESYFLKISNYEEWWKKYINDNPDFIIPTKIVKELKNNFVDKGLTDLSVTRSTFDWGININEDDKHVIYVWLDALNNYITALGYNSDNDEAYKKYWENGDEIVHIVGKEITRFHGIYWPIILKAEGIRLPSHILSHGWIITPQGKMSKSKGNVIDPIELVKKYGHEQIKYFFASQISIGQDGTFDEETLKNTLNSDLSNNFGNLLSRTVAMTLQNFEKPIEYKPTENEYDKNIVEKIKQTLSDFKKLFDNFEIDKAINQAIKLGKILNRYIDLTEPWTLKGNKKRLQEVLTHLLNGIYAMTTMLSVVIPEKAKEAINQLGFDSIDIDLVNDFSKFNNHLPKKGEVLFTRIK